MPPEIAISNTRETSQDNKIQKQNTIWMLSLYGTAVGAGTLFLPIDAGLHGIWPMLVMLLLAYPMTHYSHKALTRFVLSGSSNKADITEVVKEHFGPFAGKILTILYFLAIFPILLMYSVAITNTAHSFILNQLHISPPPRAILSLALIMGLMGIVRFGEQAIIRSLSFLVYPFICSLVLFSFYLIPHWNTALFHFNPAEAALQSKGFLVTVWMIIPVMLFSFNHLAIISSFALNQKQRFGFDADRKSENILTTAHIMMVATVMFFVFSCALSLSPQDLIMAKQQNISILSFLANHFHTPLIAYLAPLIAFIAIAKSFLGHYLGASEGMVGLFSETKVALVQKTSGKWMLALIDLTIIISCWAFATWNPNILNMLEYFGGPITAIILFLMPMYAIAKVPALRQYKRPIANSFILIMGSIAISAILYGIWEKIVLQ